jgi:hypothetical protein
MVRRSLSILMLAVASVAFGQADAPPATKPTAATTAPATLPSDASTPKGSLRMLFAATDAGDEAAIRARLYTATPLEERMADATARISGATAKLHGALVATYGAEAAHTLLPDPAIAARKRDERLPQLVETVSADGQTASIRMEGFAAVEPFEFRKVGAEWKLRVGKKLETVPAAEIEQQMAALEMQLKVLNEVAADVAAGKLKAIADVRQALEAKIRQANMEYVQAQQKAAATRPLTTVPVK